ncbi:MAG: STAS domain-containing protein [Alphaproteobacteria bacterium]|nr:STAS domain-containing protein [Alphaproteobacteria bacterium]MBR6327662.1 STAS domain-containing protein [Alphaproteobacteria bacterium]
MSDEKKLKIEQSKTNDVLFCRLIGWLDPNTSPELLKQLDLKDVKTLIIDMKDVEYVFSAGLRAFMQIQRMIDSTGGTLKLINVADTIRSIFEYTGFESMLEPKA